MLELPVTVRLPVPLVKEGIVELELLKSTPTTVFPAAVKVIAAVPWLFNVPATVKFPPAPKVTVPAPEFVKLLAAVVVTEPAAVELIVPVFVIPPAQVSNPLVSLKVPELVTAPVEFSVPVVCV